MTDDPYKILDHLEDVHYLDGYLLQDASLDDLREIHDNAMESEQDASCEKFRSNQPE